MAGRYDAYSSEDDFDLRVRHTHSPHRRPVSYVEPRPRPRFHSGTGGFLVPAADRERMIITTRDSHARSRSRDRRSDLRSNSTGVSAPPGNIIINNRIYNTDSDSSDHDSRGSSHHRRRHRSSSASRHRRRRSSSYTRSRDRERDRYALDHLRRDYERDTEGKLREYEKEFEVRKTDAELERAQRELRELKLAAQIKEDEKRRERTAKEERELREAKRELDELQAVRDREEQEKRIKQKLDLQRLKDEEAAYQEKLLREKHAKEAVEKYKKDEAERQLKEKEEAEAREKEYKRKMQEHLLKSGLDEKEINAILTGKKVAKEKEKEKADKRPTYTRMARRHLSLETLRTYEIDWQYDPDPEYVLIKRWVTEAEQDMLWHHTHYLREQRAGKLMLTIDDKKPHRHHLDPEFEWVRKKEKKEKKHSRSRSPSVLMYLAGQKR